jgi:hypothetical protein
MLADPASARRQPTAAPTAALVSLGQAQALATFLTPVAFEAEVRNGARMKRAWTDHGLELGCPSSAATNVTNCGANERRNLSARAVAAP